MDDTDYFSDYVETQIRGYDGDGHSVIINAATESHAGVMSAEDNGISLRSSNHRVSLSADNDILSLYGKSLQAGTDSASVAMDNGGNIDINAAAIEYKVARTWHLRTVSDGNNAYHVLVEQGQVKFRCSENASLAIDGDNGRINAVAGDFRFVFKNGTEREVLMSKLLDRMAALEFESSSLRTDVEYLKENSGGIGGGGSHIVEGEMLIIGSDGEIIKVSQIENDKGYLTGSVNADKIILLDD